MTELLTGNFKVMANTWSNIQEGVLSPWTIGGAWLINGRPCCLSVSSLLFFIRILPHFARYYFFVANIYLPPPNVLVLYHTNKNESKKRNRCSTFSMRCCEMAKKKVEYGSDSFMPAR